MRRMMHAAAFLLATASLGQAQSVSVNSPNAADRSLLSQSAEAPDDLETAKQFVKKQKFPAPNFIVHDSGRPYSQLAAYMTCSDWSPNLWNNYACERAATAACISKHADMRCNCFDCKQRLHSLHSGLGCGNYTSESCNSGCGTKVTNRYRQPMSTLYSESSNSCNAPCTGVSSSESSVPSIQGANTTQPASAVRPSAPSIASPPRDRVATPFINIPGSAISILNTQPSFEARR